MSYKRIPAAFIAIAALALPATTVVAAKDDNQQPLGPLPAASKTFQPAVAQTLNKMFAQHLCRASKQPTVRCIYHDHYNIPYTKAEVGISETEAIIPD